MDNKYEISVVSPVYQASGNVTELINRINLEVRKITDKFEIVLVEDGSSDDSWEQIMENCKLHSHVKAIKLSRNFGQHYAVTAGLEFAKGEVIVIMDCDLQDDPAAVTMLYDSYKQGHEIVFTKRLNRKQSFFKSFTAALYNLLQVRMLV